MNILIDTQICIWSIYDNDRLSDKTISLLKDAENYTYVIVAGLSGQRRRVLCRKRPLYLLKRGYSGLFACPETVFRALLPASGW